MAKNAGELFLLATNFYKSSKGAALSPHEKHKPEGKAYVHTEGKAVNNQEKQQPNN